MQPPQHTPLDLLTEERTIYSKSQANHKGLHDPDQIHARVFHSLRIGQKLPLYVKFHPSPANVITIYPEMATGQGQSTFYVPRLPRVVLQLTINLTPAEQGVYTTVMAMATIVHTRVEIEAAAWGLKYDHDFFNLREHNFTTYPALVNYINVHYNTQPAQIAQLQVSQLFIIDLTSALGDEWPNLAGRNAFEAYFRRLYNEVRQNLPAIVMQNTNTTFHNNMFSTSVGYISTRMDRDDIKLLKEPYASTHHPQPNANPPVPDYTNALHVGKILQLQRWPTCQRLGGGCHQPNLLHRPDMAIVLNEIRYPVAGQAQALIPFSQPPPPPPPPGPQPGQQPPGQQPGQQPPGQQPGQQLPGQQPGQQPPGQQPGQQPPGQQPGQQPPGQQPGQQPTGQQPTGQQPPGQQPGPSGQQGGGGPPSQEGNNGDEDDEGYYDDGDGEKEEEYDYEEDEHVMVGYDEYADDPDQDDYYDDEQEYPEGDDGGDEKEDSEHYDDDEDVQILEFDEQYESVYGGASNQPNRGQKRKCGDLQEEEEPVDVDVARDYEIEHITEEQGPEDPKLFSPDHSRVQDTLPRPRHSPRINQEQVTEEIAAMPLQSVHHGMRCKAARIETPQNPSTQQNPGIARKLILRTAGGPTPQPSTLTGGTHPKTVPAKGHPKTAAHGCGCGHAHGAPAGGGHGAPGGAPSGHGVGAPGVGPGVPGRGHGAAGAGHGSRARGGRGGGGAALVRNAWYPFRSPLVIVEVQGKKVNWDHNIYSSKAFCEIASALAFAPQGYIVHVFPERVDLVSAYRNHTDMTIQCEVEQINIQKNDQNLVAAFHTLTLQFVQILVKQMMTTARITTMSFDEKRQLRLNYHSDAKKGHGVACRNCFHCNRVNNIHQINRLHAVRATHFETF